MEQQEERTVSFFRFEDLRVYTKATDYATWVTVNTAGHDGQKSLVGAFCHSAYDIALNIAEGSSRSKSQFDHYLKSAAERHQVRGDAEADDYSSNDEMSY